MNIDRHNYEAWFLDHLEGRLNEAQGRDLQEFLKQHPELRQELEDFQWVELPHEPVAHPSKERLKRTFSGHTLDDLLIGELEGDLNQGEQQELEKVLEESPDARRMRNLYQKTRLEPKTVACPDKSALKKGTDRRVVWFRSAAAAAAIVALAFLLQPLLPEDDPTVAEEKPVQNERSAPEQETPAPEQPEQEAPTPSRETQNTEKDPQPEPQPSRPVTQSPEVTKIRKMAKKPVRMLPTPKAPDAIAMAGERRPVPDVALNFPETREKKIEYPEARDWLKEELTRRLMPEAGPAAFQGEKPGVGEMLAAGLARITGDNIRYERKDGEMTFSIGKFEYSRDR